MPNVATANTPPPTACTLWLPRKSRYCHFAKVSGFEFCAHHLASRGDADDAKRGKRIPCPLDPTHSVFERDLARHLKKCPKAREAREEGAAAMAAAVKAAEREKAAALREQAADAEQALERVLVAAAAQQEQAVRKAITDYEAQLLEEDA